MDIENDIYLDLRKKILTNKLKKGDRLVETALATHYQTSRLHIKSALRLLENEQLAEHILQSGFIVCGVDTGILDEVIILREALEKVVVKKVIAVALPEDIKAMRHMVERLSLFVHNGMIEDVMVELTKLYDYMYELCGYKRIVSILRMYSDYIVYIRRRVSRQEDHLVAYDTINGLMSAIEARDEEAAMKMIERRTIVG